MKACKTHLMASLVLTSRCPDISTIICEAKQAIATAPGSQKGVAQGCARPWATLHKLPCMASPWHVMAMRSTRYIAAGQGFGAPTPAVGAVRLWGAFPPWGKYDDLVDQSSLREAPSFILVPCKPYSNCRSVIKGREKREGGRYCEKGVGAPQRMAPME
jgi:hypothetical protein